MKYIIEIEDVPFTVRSTHTNEEEKLWRAKGFNSLVFDEAGLARLTPLEDPTRKKRICGQCEALNRDICYASMPPRYKCEYTGHIMAEMEQCTAGWYDNG